jgi:hypothetical protein
MGEKSAPTLWTVSREVLTRWINRMQIRNP